MRRRPIAVIPVIALLGFACRGTSPSSAPRPTPVNIAGFVARGYDAGSFTMPYRLFVPAAYDTSTRYPLVIWLHGAGGAGNDNVKQVSGDQVAGTRYWTAPQNQAKHPALVVAPQSRGVWGNAGAKLEESASLMAVIAIVRAMEREYHIDPRRIYIVGQSLGGGGAWTLITSQSNPFAAAIVLCGVSPDTTRAAAAVSTPVWVFQGDQDAPATVANARGMIAGIKRAGGTPRYTEYAGVGHDIWTRVFEEAGLADWLFAQHR